MFFRKLYTIYKNDTYIRVRSSYSYRFSDIFVDPNPVREIQSELDVIIQQGVLQITRLLKNMDRLPAVQTEEPDLSLIDDESK